MMNITGQKLIEYASEIKKLKQEMNFEEKSFDVDPLDISGAELLVPVIGEFSAGKSTIINSFLEREILPTKITPETSLATELRYSQSEKIQTVDKEDNTKDWSISDMHSIKEAARDYRYMKVFLHEEKLKKLEPFILVDMPGFNSPLDLHNQAIQYYLDKGNFYIAICPVSEGTLSRSLLNELDTINTYDADFRVILSKTDIRPEAQVREVSAHIKTLLDEQYYYNHQVFLDSDNGQNGIAAVFTSLSIDEVLSAVFAPKIKNSAYELEGNINTRITALSKKAKENEAAKKELLKGLRNIENEKITMIGKAQQTSDSSSIDNILRRVSTALNNLLEELIDVALAGKKEEFSLLISDACRSALSASLKEVFDKVSEDVLKSFKVSLSNIGNTLSEYSGEPEWLDKSGKQISQLLRWVPNALTRKSKTVYKVLATILGITTAVLNPLIEIIIIFMPEILSALFSNARKERARNKAREEITTKVFPKIKSRLRAELPDMIKEQRIKIIEEISAKYSDLINDKKNEIVKAQRDNENKEAEVKQEIAKLKHSKTTVSQIFNQIPEKEDFTHGTNT